MFQCCRPGQTFLLPYTETPQSTEYSRPAEDDQSTRKNGSGSRNTVADNYEKICTSKLRSARKKSKQKERLQTRNEGSRTLNQSCRTSWHLLVAQFFKELSVSDHGFTADAPNLEALSDSYQKSSLPIGFAKAAN